ncbi:hypothetical protein I7I50_05709 [Histoplasma capsulatum G186AR]|uniref:Uncharacterized protein n=1 Tax=Ajellomyces capsulatus TaxID=5037 RepID=A0A8H8D8X0_AJECA|nr:hypothetical protein I7I52_03969 [Histoplasma capsulatum]QSS76305.1 hypothetical protein I7I50_05709 [Histoplasma capsulatum G186AR]
MPNTPPCYGVATKGSRAPPSLKSFKNTIIIKDPDFPIRNRCPYDNNHKKQRNTSKIHQSAVLPLPSTIIKNMLCPN